MKTVRRPPYPKWNPGYFPCSSLTSLPLSSRRPSVSFGGFGLKRVGLWRSVKYEEVYLKAYESVAEARAGIGAYLRFYNSDRPHQTLDYRTSAQVFEEGRNQVH